MGGTVSFLDPSPFLDPSLFKKKLQFSSLFITVFFSSNKRMKTFLEPSRFMKRQITVSFSYDYMMKTFLDPSLILRRQGNYEHIPSHDNVIGLTNLSES